jgi:hypothetical protein
MPNHGLQLIDSFAAMVKGRGVPIRPEDNASRLRMFEEKLPKRMPQSFESFLSSIRFQHLTCLARQTFALCPLPSRVLGLPDYDSLRAVGMADVVAVAVVAGIETCKGSTESLLSRLASSAALLALW